MFDEYYVGVRRYPGFVSLRSWVAGFCGERAARGLNCLEDFLRGDKLRWGIEPFHFCWSDRQCKEIFSCNRLD